MSADDQELDGRLAPAGFGKSRAMEETGLSLRAAAAAPGVPPVEPMLARLARTLPRDGYLYEPKWDGFRCLAFCSSDGVELQSRNGRPLARYFPEIVEALAGLPEPAVLDGELVVVRGTRFDFEALLARLHPAASRVALLSREAAASYVVFDALALGET